VNAFCGRGPQLKELEEEEIITRNVDVTAFPVRTEYTLTDSGLEIVDIIRNIMGWALKWKTRNPPCGQQDCKVCVL
jgi:DNA-binding HxlR family transcriptional regulator